MKTLCLLFLVVIPLHSIHSRGMKHAPKAGEIGLDSRRFGFGQDGNYFLVKCNKAVKGFDSNDQAQTKRDAYNVGYCEGLVSAVATDLVFEDHVDLDTSRPSVRQLIQVAIKYMNDHREQLHESSVELITDSLKEAFPSKP